MSVMTTIKMKTAIPFALLAMAMASHGAVAARAALGDDVLQRRISFADLDLTRSAGAATLYARIISAAREVCEPPSPRMLLLSEDTRQCRQQAIARAVEDVNAPTLTSYYATKTTPTPEQR
jgi:UrcA family protein